MALDAGGHLWIAAANASSKVAPHVQNPMRAGALSAVPLTWRSHSTKKMLPGLEVFAFWQNVTGVYSSHCSSVMPARNGKATFRSVVSLAVGNDESRRSAYSR